MWQIISTNKINCTSVLRGFIDTCKEIVWHIIAARTLNCTVVFQHRALSSGTVYMYHCSVVKHFDQHIDEYRHCAKDYQKIWAKNHWYKYVIPLKVCLEAIFILPGLGTCSPCSKCF